MTRTPLYLALALAAAIPAALAGPAHSDDPPVPQEVLPDLRQLLPANVKVGSVGGQWRLGFDSEVVNDGPGYLKIRGTGPGGGPMTADQVIQMDDGSSTTVPGIGEMHYVMANHNHWHLLDFERYELRNGDSDQTLVTDQKTGFCLADAFTTTFCGQDQPGLTSVEEGISNHGSDRYLAYLEGQYIVVSQATVPDGSYVLVHRVNPSGALHVANPANDAASVRITMAWTNGTPNMAVVNQCPGTTICPAPPDPPPTDPKPDPQPEPAPATTTPAADPVTTAPGPELPAPEPQPVPIVNPVPQIAAARAAMSRGMAVRLVRKAIAKSSKQAPKRLRMICGRDDRASFTCLASWHGAPATRVWSGRVRVWFRLKNSELSWYYDLSAKRRPDGKRLVTRAARGSAARLVFATADGSLICRRIDLG